MKSYVRTACLLVLTTSCVGTEIGNPPTPTEAQVSVDMVGVEDAPATSVPIALMIRDGLDVDRALIGVGDLRLSNCSEPGDDLTDGFVSELLEPGVELADLALPVGEYCRLDVRPRRGGSEGFADGYPELDGLTAYAEGTYLGTPFIVRNESDDELTFEGRFELPAGEQTLFVAVDIGAWFDDLDLDAAETDADGRILIGHEGSFGEQLKDNVIRSVSVALDANGDKKLTGEDDETDDDDAEAE